VKLNYKIRDLRRVSEVVNILFKHEFGYFIEKLELKHHIPLIKLFFKKGKKEIPKNPAVQLRKVFEDLGGTFVKFGQLLSLRPDLIPPEYCSELSKLQDEVPPISFSKVKETIESEFRMPLNQLFKKFEPVPIAAASIGQVHKAILKDGKKVAVKIQRPKIAVQMEEDIHILYYFAHKFNRVLSEHAIDPLFIIQEFEHYTKQELNYTHEARNAERFYENFKNDNNIITPKVYTDYTTDKILVLEFIEGIKLKDIGHFPKSFSKKKAIRKGFDAAMKMIFEDGFFHADLHPGNILITGKKIAFIDFGIVGSMRPEIRKESVNIFLSIMNNDTKETADVLIRLAIKPKDFNETEFRREIFETIDTWFGSTLKQQAITIMLHKLLRICGKYRLKMPRDLVLLGKGTVTLEGVCRTYDPDFDFLKEAKPYFKKIMKKELFNFTDTKNLINDYRKIKNFATNFPDYATDIMQRLQSGNFHFDVDSQDMKTLSKEVDKSSNRLAYGMLIASFVISGALLITVKIPPIIYDYSAAGILMFMISGVFLMILSISIIKEKI
jgi:ubiquinone biosynthesis protein